MAVSFKVPASPKRDIFNMDTFLGVDLTNTGSNIEETRSPNAENMVRYVPGKVRKRMGYSVPVEFSEGTDVNRVLNTTSEWVEIPCDGTELIYDIATDGNPINKPYYYLELYGIGTFQFGFILGDDTRRTFTRSGTEETPYDDDFWGYAGNDFSGNGGTKGFFLTNTSNGANDVLRVRALRVFRKTKYSYEKFEKENIWKPAPEDNGNAFILTSSTTPVYGHHILRTGKKQGDFVTNVNRALGTTDAYQTFWDSIIAKTGESIPRGKHIYVSFDVNATNATDIYIGRPGEDPRTIIQISAGRTGHVEHDFDAFTSFTYFSYSDNTTQIKNFMVCYEVDSSLTWSAAPEDKGGTFDASNVYAKIGDSTAIYSQYSDRQIVKGASQPATQWFYAEAALQQESTAIKDKPVVIEFDLSLDLNVSGTSYTIEKFIVELEDNLGHTYYFDWINGQPSNYHIKLYVCPDTPEISKFIQYAKFVIGTPSPEGAGTAVFCDMGLNNISVYEVEEKTDFWSSAYINLYHVGQKLYANKSGQSDYKLIYSDMNQYRSMSWQFEARDNSSQSLGHDNLYILDGKTYLEYDGATESISAVNNNGKIPLITYAKSPSGGGTPYYAVNRLQPGFEEMFIGDGSATSYQLSFGNLDMTPVRVWIKDRDDGSWQEQAEGSDFTVNYGLGMILFDSPPWDNTPAGEDNVKIRAFRTVQRYADSINKCTFGTLFGVGGTSNRLFISGNPDYPNHDFYSAEYDPTYFPDLYYSTLGVSSSAIKGYARVNNYLATFKDENEPSQSVFIREGDLVVDENNVSNPAFKLINTLQGNGAISPYTFGYLQTEPLFLTKSGIFAITAQDITGEKYGQARSFYLNGSLLKENNLEDATSVVYNDMYVLAINGHLYCLDGLQPTRTDAQMPYATRQYVGFYCTGINANILWTAEDTLWFGSGDGKICKFYTDVEDTNSYNDDGVAIYGCWETPDLDGRLFYKNKTFRYFAIRLMKSIRTTVVLSAAKLGNWTAIKEDTLSGIVFDFENIDFENFSFSTDRSEKVVHTKVRVKKVDKARFKVENNKVNEPFGLFDLALEYVERGNYKG